MTFFLTLSLLVVCAAQPINVRTEYETAPILVDNPNPRFSWQEADGLPQIAFRVQVGDSPLLATLLWDSGVVLDNSTSQVVYEGEPLPSDRTFYVQVSSQTSSGLWRNSTLSSFGTGLLTPEAWAEAVFIGGYNQMRGTFSLPVGSVSRARAYVSGVGCAELWVNGQRVSNDTQGRETFYNPGFSTIFSKRLLYNAFDITSLLQPGKDNAVGLRLGQCKYGYLGEFCVGGPTICNRGIVTLTVNGAPVFVSGPSWMGAQSSILFDHFYNGETVDGRLAAAEEGWSTADFNASGFSPVTVMASPTAQLSAHALPAITGLGPSFSAVSVTPIPARPGGFVFDLKYNGAGHCTANLPGPTPAGIHVVFTMAEIYNDTGTEDVRVQFACPCPCCLDGGNCANQTFTYITRGVPAGSVESFRPTFAYSGFRYVRVENWPAGLAPPTLSTLSCLRTSSGVEDAGKVAFNSSTPGGSALNAIQDLILRTQRSNLHSIPTDCPQREKRGWMADAGVTAPEASFNFNMASFYENWLRTHADTSDVGCGPLTKNWTCPKWNKNQPGFSHSGHNFASRAEVDYLGTSTPGGDVPNCYICCFGRPGFGCVPGTPTDFVGSVADVIPFDKNGYGSMPGSITWMSTSFIVAGILLEQYKSLQFLGRIYPQLCAHMDFYVRAADSKTGLVGWDQYGDWNGIVATNGLLIANMLFITDNLIMASIAGALGKTVDEAVFLARASTLRVSVKTAYFNANAGYWDKGSQTAQAMALVFGLDPTSTESVLHQLVSDIASRGNHISGGVFGSRYLLQALSTYDRGDVALQVVTVPTEPSWLAMALGTPTQPPLGTLWESWNGPIHGGDSGNHPFLGGGAGIWMYRYALGLRFGYRPEASRDVEAQACLARLGFALDLGVTHGLSAKPACAVASAVEGLLAEMNDGGGSLSSHNIRKHLLKSGILSGGAPGVEAASSGEKRAYHPTGSLVLDAHVAKALQGASGSLETPRGKIDLNWHWSEDGGLSVELTLPALDSFEVFIPMEFLSGVDAPVEVSISKAFSGGIVWRTIVSSSVTTVKDSELAPSGEMGVHAAWVGPGDANQLVAPLVSSAVSHMRVSLPPGVWIVRAQRQT